MNEFPGIGKVVDSRIDLKYYTNGPEALKEHIIDRNRNKYNIYLAGSNKNSDSFFGILIERIGDDYKIVDYFLGESKSPYSLLNFYSFATAKLFDENVKIDRGKIAQEIYLNFNIEVTWFDDWNNSINEGNPEKEHMKDSKFLLPSITTLHIQEKAYNRNAYILCEEEINPELLNAPYEIKHFGKHTIQEIANTYSKDYDRNIKQQIPFLDLPDDGNFVII